MKSSRVFILKGFAIVGVVLYHVINRRFEDDTKNYLQLIRTGFSWCVYAFLFLSGYLQARSSKSENWQSHAIRRAKRLLIPYLVIGLAYALLYQIIQNLKWVETNPPLYPPTLCGKIFELLICRSPVGVQLYFFVLLFLVSVLVFPFVERWKLRRVARVLAVIFTIFCIFECFFPCSLPTVGLSNAMILIGIFEYSLGFLFGRTECFREAWLWCAGAAGLITGTVAIIRGSYATLMMIIPLLVFMLLQSISVRGRFFQIFEVLGEASSTIFAFHSPFILSTIIILQLKLAVPSALNASLSLLLTLAICAGLHIVITRNKQLKFLRI